MSDSFAPDSVTRSKRYLTKESAQIEVYGRRGKIFCRLGNLSSSGAFLEVVSSRVMPRQGDLVRITIQLRQLNKIHVLDAEVVWCKGTGIGMYFIKRDEVAAKLSNRIPVFE